MNISKENQERIEKDANEYSDDPHARQDYYMGKTHEHGTQVLPLMEKIQSLKEEREKDRKALEWHSNELQSLIKKNDSLKEENERFLDNALNKLL